MVCVDDCTQPQLLVKMLAYAKRELIATECIHARVGDVRRLTVYQELFSYFIDHFKTYEPILCDIKREYDSHIEGRNIEASENGILRNQIGVFRYEADLELDGERQASQTTIEDLRQDKVALNDKLSKLWQRIDDQETIIGGFKLELEAKTKEINNEDRNYYRMLEYKVKWEELGEVFRTQMEIKRKEMDDLERDRMRYKVDYELQKREVISLREDTKVRFVLKTVHEESFKANESLRGTLAEEKIRGKSLESEISKLNLEVLELHKAKIAAIENAKRPDWKWIEVRLNHEMSTSSKMYNLLDSNNVIVLMNKEMVKLRKNAEQILTGEEPRLYAPRLTTIAAVNAAEEKQVVPMPCAPLTPKMFVGQGAIGVDVPKHLRYKGKLVNRRLRLRDTVMIIRDIWKAKKEWNEKGEIKTNLVDFFLQYIRKWFSDKGTVFEWTYNIHEAAKTFSPVSAECNTFYEILMGRLDEQFYFAFQHLIYRQLLTNIANIDAQIHDGNPLALIPKQKMLQCVQDMWKRHKSDAEILDLKEALEVDQAGQTLSYAWLFSPEVDSLFIDKLLAQELKSRQDYITKFVNGLPTQTSFSADNLADFFRRFDDVKTNREIEIFVKLFFEPREVGTVGCKAKKGKKRADKKATPLISTVSLVDRKTLVDRIMASGLYVGTCALYSNKP